MTSRTPIGTALLIAAALAAAGCGWRSSLEPPGDARTVGVEIFTLPQAPDVVPQRDLEPEFHSQLSRAVSDLVHARLVPVASADVVVRGRITGYRRRGGVRSAENELLETGVRIGVEAWLVDGRTGEPLGRHASAARWAGFAVGDPAAEPAARARAMRTLSERLVLELFGAPRPAGVEESSLGEPAGADPAAPAPTEPAPAAKEPAEPDPDGAAAQRAAGGGASSRRASVR